MLSKETVAPNSVHTNDFRLLNLKRFVASKWKIETFQIGLRSYKIIKFHMSTKCYEIFSDADFPEVPRLTVWRIGNWTGLIKNMNVKVEAITALYATSILLMEIGLVFIYDPNKIFCVNMSQDINMMVALMNCFHNGVENAFIFEKKSL